MSGWRSDRRFQAYALVTAFAALCAVLAPAPAPLPTLRAGRVAPDGGSDSLGTLPSSSVSEAPQENTLQDENPVSASGADASDDIKDAVAAAPVMPPGLGAGHFTTMWIAEAGRAPTAQTTWRSAAIVAPAAGPRARGEREPRGAGPERSSPMARDGARPSNNSLRGGPASLRFAADKARESISASGRGTNPRAETNSRSAGQSSRERQSASGGALWKAARFVSSGSKREGEKDKEDKDEKSKRPPKHKPLLRHKLLGAPKPPKISKVPSQNPWSKSAPQALADGRAIDPVPPKTLAAVEAITPPEGKADHLSTPHWHDDGATEFYHDGKSWGRWSDGNWTWLERAQGHWWLWVNAGDPPLVWHEDHWWWQSHGTWFVLHDGDAWVYRYINDWQQEGLTHQDGSQMIYSPDAGEVAVVEPGSGARFYDSETGKSMGTLNEKQLPERNHPKAPTQLTLPQ